MSNDPVRLYYTGRGFIPGVPRRDLRDADLARVGENKVQEITAKHPTSGQAVYQKSRPASRTADDAPAPVSPPRSTRHPDPTQDADEPRVPERDEAAE